jgi:hypothetical protein
LWHCARLDDRGRRVAFGAVGVVFRYLASRGYLAFALQEVTLYVIGSRLEVARRFSPTAPGLGDFAAGFSAPSALDAQGRFFAESTVRDGPPAGEDLGVFAPAGLVLSRDLVTVYPAAQVLTV